MHASSKRTRRRGAAALLLVASACPAAPGAPLPLEAVRVALPAEVEHDGQRSTLLPRHRIALGDTVMTGSKGRAAVQLAGLGTMTLGAHAALYVHSAEPPDAGRGALARIALLRGAMRMDSSSRHGLPPQDFRVNAGRLQLRVFGAEVWVEISARGEDVCLLNGAVEIMAQGAQDRLDTPGSCLLFGPGGRRLRVHPDARETLARKLVRTAFAEDYVTRLAAERADDNRSQPIDELDPEAPPAQGFTTVPIEEVRLAPQPLPPQAPTVAQIPSSLRPAPPAAPAPGPAPAEGSAASGVWTVVVASLADATAAETEAARLRKAGLPAQARVVSRDGVTRHRVTLGPVASREAARKLAVEVQQKHPLASAWVTEY